MDYRRMVLPLSLLSLSGCDALLDVYKSFQFAQSHSQESKSHQFPLSLELASHSNSQISTSSEKTTGVLSDSDLEPPAHPVATSLEGLAFAIEKNPIFMLEENLEGQKQAENKLKTKIEECVEKQIQGLQYVSKLDQLEVRGSIRFDECANLIAREQDKPLKIKSSYVVEVAGVISCQGVDFVKRFEAAKSDKLTRQLLLECRTSSATSFSAQVKTRIHSFKTGKQIEAVIKNADQTRPPNPPDVLFEKEKVDIFFLGAEKGMPCEGENKAGVFELHDGCMVVEKMTTLRDLQDGRIPEGKSELNGQAESYSRFESKNLKLVNNLGNWKYFSGKWAGFHNGWKGEISFSPNSSQYFSLFHNSLQSQKGEGNLQNVAADPAYLLAQIKQKAMAWLQGEIE